MFSFAETSADEDSMFVYATKHKLCEVGLSQLVKKSAGKYLKQQCRNIDRHASLLNLQCSILLYTYNPYQTIFRNCKFSTGNCKFSTY